MIEDQNEKALNLLVTHLLKSINYRKSLKAEIINELGCVEDLTPVFVEPECNRAYIDTSKMWNSYGSEYNYDFIFPVIKNITISKSFNSKNQILLLADAGMGKTSLLKMLAYNNGVNNFLPSKYRFRVFKIDEDLIEKLREIKKSTNVILLLDSLDEDFKAWEDFDKRLLEILTETKRFYRTFITSRAQFFEYKSSDLEKNTSITICGRELQTLYLLPFFNYQVKKYVENKYKVLKTDKELNIRNKEAFTKNVYSILNSMNELKMRPMLLNHIDDFLDNKLVIWNQYTVYKRLVEKWLNRELSTKVTNCSVTSQNEKYDHQSMFNELFECCIELALFAQKEEVAHISESNLIRIFEENRKLLVVRSIQLKGKTLLFRNSKGNYTFSHYSIQEYLIAHAFLHRSELAFNSEILATENVRKFVIEGAIYEKLALNNDKFYIIDDLQSTSNQIIMHIEQLNNISNCDFSRCVCINWYLRSIRVENINFELSDFYKIYAENTQFNNVHFRGGTLNEFEGSSSKFENCNFYEVEVANSNFTDASFTNTNFSKTTFKSKYAENIIFSNCKFQENTTFDLENMKNVRFENVKFDNSTIIIDNIYNVTISNSNVNKLLISSRSESNFEIINSKIDEVTYRIFKDNNIEMSNITVMS